MKGAGIVCGLCLCWIAGAVGAVELSAPEPPTAEVAGEPGKGTVCYWVFAESAEKALTSGAWYLKQFPGKVTGLSRPCLVRNAPDVLDQTSKVVLALTQVEGAARYHVFKTELLAPSRLQVQPKKPGDTSLYYWVQGHNGWRNSELGWWRRLIVTER